MNIWITIRLAIHGLLVNKIRAFLTILGIIIGVASIIIIVAVGNGAESLITNQVESAGTNLIGIVPGGKEEGQPPVALFGIVVTTLKIDDILALKDIPFVAEVNGYTKSVEPVVYRNKKTETTISGTFATYPAVKDAYPIEGRFFSDAENNGLAKVVVLGSAVKEELFGESNPIGESVKIRNQSFKVIGYMAQRGVTGFQNNDTQVFVPIKTMQKLILGVNHIGFGQVRVDKEENIEFVVEEIKKELRIRHDIDNPKNDDFTAASAAQGLDVLRNITGSINDFLVYIAAIALIVGGVGIMNVMFIAVRERTHEIGLRKALGAKRSDILAQFLIEAVSITGLGGIIGILFGLFVSFVIAFIIQALGYSWDYVVTLSSVIIASIVITMIGITFGYAPARKAAHLSAIDALRYE